LPLSGLSEAVKNVTPATIVVGIGRLGQSSLTFSVAIFHHAQDTLIVCGEAVWVNVDQITHKSTPIPSELKQRLKERFPELAS